MPTAFHDACTLIEHAIGGEARQRLVADLARSKPLGRALARLREHMRSNSFDSFLDAFDRRTRQEGFHALHDWDGKAEQVLGDTIPVDVLDYVARQRSQDETAPGTLAILLDYYYLHVLSLLALRVWDSGDADDNLDRVASLLATLQGEGGSGQVFVADAETLILFATSHYEAVERGYDRLLARVRTLNHDHQLKIALGHASSMGCHLRFGFEATYRRDTVAMRDDNVADYPWLCFALTTLMREYVARARSFRPLGTAAASTPVAVPTSALLEALANGLSADARAFVGAAPPSLAAAEPERAEFRDAFAAHRTALIAAFARLRPHDDAYSPFCFFFNFSHNVLKGAIVDASLRGEPWPVSFNDLLRSDGDAPAEARQQLARRLMEYARASPDRINGELTPVIVYDPRAGARAYRVMMEKLAEPPPPAP